MNIVKILFATTLVVGFVSLAIFQWSDCLDENSIFTCVRMLNK